MTKLFIDVPATLKVEDFLKGAARLANHIAPEFKTLKFEGAFGHHSFFRNVEKAYVVYSVDVDEVGTWFIQALENLKNTLCPNLYFYTIEEYDDVSKPETADVKKTA